MYSLGVTHGHWKRHNSIDHIRLRPTIVAYLVPLSSCLTLKFKYRDLEISVRGHSRSLKIVPFESLGTVSYSNSIATIVSRFDTIHERRQTPHGSKSGAMQPRSTAVARQKCGIIDNNETVNPNLPCGQRVDYVSKFFDAEQVRSAVL